MLEVKKYWSYSRVCLVSVFYEHGKIRTCYWDLHKKISKKFAKSLLNKDMFTVPLGDLDNTMFKYKI